jgi:hypothetical protein
MTRPAHYIGPEEWHTSDLAPFSGCARAVQLRHEGQEFGQTGEALHRGHIMGASLEWLYGTGEWKKLDQAVAAGQAEARKTAEADNRPLSDAVVKKESDIVAECRRMLACYAARLAPRPDDSILGTEIPCRMTLANGEALASHLDLAFERNGELHIWDWKAGDKFPPLNRNLQLGIYWLMGKRGALLLGQGLEFEFWHEPNQWPTVAWIHLRDLRPKARGDNPLRECGFDPDCADTLEAELMHIIAARRAGYWPMSPGESCWHCDSWRACPQWARSDQ